MSRDDEVREKAPSSSEESDQSDGSDQSEQSENQSSQENLRPVGPVRKIAEKDAAFLIVSADTIRLTANSLIASAEAIREFCRAEGRPPQSLFRASLP